MIKQAVEADGSAWIKPVLRAVVIAPSTWYRRHDEGPAARQGPLPLAPDPALCSEVLGFATRYPLVGLQASGGGDASGGLVSQHAPGASGASGRAFVPDSQGHAGRVASGQQVARTAADAAECAVAGGRHLHPLPGYGWWYAVTVIDYYSRIRPVAPILPRKSNACEADGFIGIGVLPWPVLSVRWSGSCASARLRAVA